MRLFAPLYDQTLRWARHSRAPWALSVLSFIESVIFPIPTDIMLAPMVLAEPLKWQRYATLATVAAAMEGRTLGLPAIAVSVTSRTPQHYETAARITRSLIRRLSEQPLPSEIILNVNVPDLPIEELRGLRMTRLGHRHRAEPAIRQEDGENCSVWRVGPPGADKDGGKGTDFHAVREGFVSITPMQVDLTRHRDFSTLSEWLRQISL